MKLKTLILAFVVSVMAATSANAAIIGISDFDSPTIDEFNDLSTLGGVSAPLVRGDVTITSDNGLLRTFAPGLTFANCTNGCVTNDSGFGVAGFLQLDFAQPYQRVGALVGSAFTTTESSAEFFDTNFESLGVFSLPPLDSGGSQFFGFENLSGITRVIFRDLDSTDTDVLSIERLLFENVPQVPLPAAFWFMGAGIAVFGAWKKKATV